jgi:hypothetical protein
LGSETAFFYVFATVAVVNLVLTAAGVIYLGL